MSQSNIPVNEIYCSLVDKADKKFSKIKNLPYYERNRYDTYFCKVFKVYTQLWKFQQENRQKLVEAGLKRWEIGEIASRIAQLYFGQYMRTGEASYLLESFIFYEAVLFREYFKEGLFQDVNLANKQLRFLARFITVCLVLNRREMVHQLVNQLTVLLDECKRTFQETDFKEWKLVVQEIVRFLKADSAYINIRPLRYSIVLDLHPDLLPQVAAYDGKKNLRLRDAILSTFHLNEVKYSELTLDAFRMLQCLEWEPSGSFYQASGIPLSSTSTTIGQNGGGPGPSRINYSQDITDPTLPPNPRKAVLYHPSATHLLAVLATISEELSPDGVILIYLSASGTDGQAMPSLSSANISENMIRNFRSHSISTSNPSSSHSDGDHKICLYMGTRRNGGLNCIYPCDLIPFTRRPLLIIIDSDGSKAFKAIKGAEKGEPAAILLSPCSSPPIHHASGSLFTMFLTSPLQAFYLLLGFSGSDSEMGLCHKAEKLLSASLNDWGLTLAASDNLDPLWARLLSDPFIRRLLLRYIFCWAVLTLYAPTFGKEEFFPECMPALPESVQPTSVSSQNLVFQLANIFGATQSFIFSEGIVLPKHIHIEEDPV